MSQIKMTRAFNARNEVVSIEDVNRGLSCECFCIECGGELQARKGEKKAHHFSHHSNSVVAHSCKWTPESELHLIAKEVICEDKFAKLPIGTINPVYKDFTFDEVRSEVREGKRIPDIVADYHGEAILIEIAVTHFCGPEKIRDFKRSNANVIEFDLSGYKFDGETISKDEVREILKEAPAKLLSVAPVGSFAEECHQQNKAEMIKLHDDAKKQREKAEKDAKFWYARMKRSEDITYAVVNSDEFERCVRSRFRFDDNAPNGTWVKDIEVFIDKSDPIRDSLPVYYRNSLKGDFEHIAYGEMSKARLKPEQGYIHAAFASFQKAIANTFFIGEGIENYAAICKKVCVSPLESSEKHHVDLYMPKGLFSNKITRAEFNTKFNAEGISGLKLSVLVVELED